MNFTKKFNKNKGITLIALVVTIIVLLILAGISINMLTADNGIITQTLNAKNLTEDAKIDESLQLSVADALAQGVGILKDNNLKEALNSYIGSGKYVITGNANEGWKITIGEKNLK